MNSNSNSDSNSKLIWISNSIWNWISNSIPNSNSYSKFISSSIFKLRLTFKFKVKFRLKFNSKLRFYFKFNFKFSLKFNFKLIFGFKMVISNETNGPLENRSSSSWLKIFVWKQNNSNFSLLYLNMSSKKLHSMLCSQHFNCVGRIETSCLLRKSIVNHPFMVRKILKFIPSRHVKNVLPRLKSYIKLLNPKNMFLERPL